MKAAVAFSASGVPGAFASSFVTIDFSKEENIFVKHF